MNAALQRLLVYGQGIPVQSAESGQENGPEPDRESTEKRVKRFRYHAQIFSESAIYGLITVSTLIIVKGQYDSTAIGVFLKVLGSVVVFWFAHFFAHAVAHLSMASSGKPDFAASFRHAMGHSVGVLLAAIIPLSIVFVGVLEIINDETAVWAALWADVVLLGLFGFISSGSWTQMPIYRFGASVVTALLGVFIVLLKTLIH